MYINVLWCIQVALSEEVISGCIDPTAHNFNPNATVDIQNCQFCNDGKQNGDEEGIDCGGQHPTCSECDFCLTVHGCPVSWRGDNHCDASCNNPTCDFDSGDCVVGCMEADAHNYNRHAVVSLNNCELCHDLKMNGDEEEIDCGGTNPNCTACDTCDALGCPKSWRGNGQCDQLCNNPECDTDGKDCVVGCTNSTAHNFNADAKFEDDSCTFCTDGVMNADEVGVDCGGALCRPCVFDCLDVDAHNFNPFADVHIENCTFCWDNVTNGDEEGVDCGGDNPFCDPCTFGCMDPVAHNFNPNATGSNETECEFCYDRKMNGDEWGIDCGGAHPDCNVCEWGCMHPEAHNFNPNATAYNDSFTCEFCNDGIQNADELGIDCWSENPQCGECVPDCMNPTAHNFNPNATIEMLPNHTSPDDFFSYYLDIYVNSTNQTNTSSPLAVCMHCSDGDMNGDELGVDCGGSNSLCIPCIPGCMEQHAHNFDLNATQNMIPMCEFCDDGIMNADEQGVDCGGNNWLCPPCDFGCMHPQAHNFDLNATTDTPWTCEFCDDGTRNGDEMGIDCDSHSSLCGLCIYGCMDPLAHNFFYRATAALECDTCFDGFMNGDEEGIDCGGTNPNCVPCIPSGNFCGNNTSIGFYPCEAWTMCVKTYMYYGYVNRALCSEDDTWEECVCAPPWCSDVNATNFHPNPSLAHLFNTTDNATYPSSVRRLDAELRSDSRYWPLELEDMTVAMDHDVSDRRALLEDMAWNSTENGTAWNDTAWNSTDWNETEMEELFFEVCVSCNDSIRNGDEEGIDCGGRCPPCALSCADPHAHNYAPVPKDTPGFREFCETCYDNKTNGDELALDCGGRCALCPTYCLKSEAHNVELKAINLTTMIEYCEMCNDGIQNGDEEGADCGGKCPTVCDACAIENKCALWQRGNLECNLNCMAAICNWDDNDCESCTTLFQCGLSSLGDSICQSECNHEVCQYDRGDCDLCAVEHACHIAYRGNGTCENACNNELCDWDGNDCTFGCTDSGAHNFDPHAANENGKCSTCADLQLNGDEHRIDCGGVRCPPCAFGCTDVYAHNYNASVNVDDGSCLTCYDKQMNGDETDVDCGGPRCVQCIFGCMNTQAHNYMAIAEFDDGSCMTCVDMKKNGDEDGVDCGGSNPLCTRCVGCIEPHAHNYVQGATVDDGSCVTCSDSVRNGDEELIDCGGKICPKCIYGCVDASAHNFVANAHASDNSCLTCDDRVKNGDETAVDCGGIKCVACTGCMDAEAHNYFAPATEPSLCLTCFDLLRNADEEATDCGGERCRPCIRGCMQPGAHNYNVKNEIGDESCTTCADGMLNGDEEEIDCGGRCAVCVVGCINDTSHNFNPLAQIADECYTCDDGLINGDEEDVDCGGLCMPCEYESASGLITSAVPPDTKVDSQYLMEIVNAVKFALVASLHVDESNVQVQVSVDTVEPRRLLDTVETGRQLHTRSEPQRLEDNIARAVDFSPHDVSLSRIWNVDPNMSRRLATIRVLNTWYTVKNIVKASMVAVKEIVDDQDAFAQNFEKSLRSSGFEITVTASEKCELPNCDMCAAGNSKLCDSCTLGYAPSKNGTECVQREDTGWCAISNCETCEEDFAFRCGICRVNFILANGQCVGRNSNGTTSHWHHDGNWLVRQTSCAPNLPLLALLRGTTSECKIACENSPRCAAFMAWTTTTVSRCVLLWDLCYDSQIRGDERVYVKFRPCTCQFGEPEIWGDGVCSANGADRCKSCRESYHMTDEFHCEVNACKCDHGDAMPPWLCAAHGTHACAVCRSGFTLTDSGICEIEKVEDTNTVVESGRNLTLAFGVGIPLALVFVCFFFCRRSYRRKVGANAKEDIDNARRQQIIDCMRERASITYDVQAERAKKGVASIQTSQVFQSSQGMVMSPPGRRLSLDSIPRNTGGRRLSSASIPHNGGMELPDRRQSVASIPDNGVMALPDRRQSVASIPEDPAR